MGYNRAEQWPSLPGRISALTKSSRRWVRAAWLEKGALPLEQLLRFGVEVDVTPNGQRFLMLEPAEQEAAAATQINVVLNWFEELKRRVPAGKSQ